MSPDDTPRDKAPLSAVEENCQNLSELIDEEINTILSGKEFPLTTEGDRAVAQEKIRAFNNLREILPTLIRNEHIVEKLDRQFIGECLEVLIVTYHEGGGNENPSLCISALQEEMPLMHMHLKRRWKQN